MTWKPGVTETLGPDGYDSCEFFGPRRSTEITSSPQAFGIQLGSDFHEVGAHFHRVDQFQLMVGGGARFGGKDVAAGDLHYSDRFQPYGPFKPQENGMTFYTLRPNTADGVFYMPDSQPQLRADLAGHRDEARCRRNLTHHLLDVPVGSADEWAEIDSSEAGMRVALWAAPTGTTAPEVEAGGAGAYVVVIVGEIEVDGGRFGQGSLTWLASGTSVGPIVSCAPETRVALLQYPLRQANAEPVTVGA